METLRIHPASGRSSALACSGGIRGDRQWTDRRSTVTLTAHARRGLEKKVVYFPDAKTDSYIP